MADPVAQETLDGDVAVEEAPAKPVRGTGRYAGVSDGERAGVEAARAELWREHQTTTQR